MLLEFKSPVGVCNLLICGFFLVNETTYFINRSDYLMVIICHCYFHRLWDKEQIISPIYFLMIVSTCVSILPTVEDFLDSQSPCYESVIFFYGYTVFWKRSILSQFPCYWEKFNKKRQISWFWEKNLTKRDRKLVFYG